MECIQNCRWNISNESAKNTAIDVGIILKWMAKE
jgi:hypothetical protein